MPFDWMHVQRKNQPVGPKTQVAKAIREQAALLRRLGYDAKYATKRCLANVHWQYEDQVAPLKDTEIKKVVAAVFS